MSDKAADQSGSAEPGNGEDGGDKPFGPPKKTPPPPARAVTSPFDAPTEQLPRTDDELGGVPDDQIPTYTGDRDDETKTYSYASIPPATPVASDPQQSKKAATVLTADQTRFDPSDRGRGTTDLGLLLLRVMLGATFIYHGSMKLVSWGSGRPDTGYNATKKGFASLGWRHEEILAILATVGELGGGILLVLGLATPFAAASIFAIMIDAWLSKQGMATGFQYKKNSIEYDTILIGLAASVVLLGPGRISADTRRGWATRPSWGSLLLLVVFGAAALGAWFWLHGGNPLR